MNPRSYKSAVRAEAAERTRKKLVTAATAVLGSGIIGDFSLDAVAKKAGVTRLTVYNQFGSRRALLEAVFDDRAARAGLHRIAEAMARPDPIEGLRMLVSIFCDFWSYDEGTLQCLHATSNADAEFCESLTARNERRRSALSILVHRIPTATHLNRVKQHELIDTLFALTSFRFFAELSARGRSKVRVCRIIQALVEDVLSHTLTSL